LIDRLLALEVFGIKLGLANIRALCAALGHPERSFVSLHVGGTNGKGSVTAMAHAALHAAGVRAARYTSPHLVDLNERFVIGDRPVDDATLGAAAERVLDCADGLVAAGVLPAPPTFFEATTAIAFELFRSANVDVAVLEVGLGGHFDATNVVTPVAAAITSIGLDHQQYLGGTLAAIAREKAGIIKPGVPVVTGALPSEAAAVIADVAAEQDAPLVRADAMQHSTRMDEGRAVIDVTTAVHHYGPLRVGLRGGHQAGNALVAIALLEQARAGGVAIPFDAIERGLVSAAWPARLEMLAFAEGRRLLLDAAHNADGALALAAYLRAHHPDRPPLVFGAMRDKDVAAIIAPLLPVVGAIVLTAAATPRASTPGELAAAVRALDPARDVIVEADPLRAVDTAWRHAPLVCVAGSIFLAGAVRGALERRAIVDPSH
jgi:dihydrofolate synthase / folylpolyglutamate synthase